MRTITDDQRRVRIGRRHALTTRAGSVAEAVAAMTCLHATEPASVYLSAAARADASRADIDQALYVDRSVVKQLSMRRTLFAYPRDLLPAVWGSAAARVAAQQHARLAKEVEQHGHAVDGAAWVATAYADVLAHLREHGPTTTQQLREALPALELRLSLSPGTTWAAEVSIAPRVLTALAADGSVLRGENDGGWKTSRPRWTVTEQWLGSPAEPLSEADGYAALVAAWLATFGPGTEEDVVWWLGATKAAVRKALAAVGAEQVALQGGTPAWVGPGDIADVGPAAPWAALLPALDPTTMGWKERGFYLGGHGPAIFDRNGNGGPTAWWDGRIVGSWHQEQSGEVRLALIDDVGKAGRAALESEAGRLTSWLDGDVVNTIYQAPMIRELRRTS
ncbi:MAG TPA: winged helix DNA-binding domain-containing protein [Marmoricola sp.]|nr:winged helix DNA-binding domain-containing protein [Marmoricola sp.]